MPLLKVAKTASNDVTNAAGEGGKKGEEIPKLKIASLARPLAGSSIKPSTSTSSIPIKLTVVAPPPAGTSHPVSSVGAETAARNDASGNPPGGREGGRGQSAAIYPLASEASMPPPGRPAKEEMRENVKAEEVEEEDDPDVMDAEEGEGLEDAEMAQAVAGEEPVLLQEEGAVEAYAEARSEQQKQLEELKLKVRRGGRGEGGREGERAVEEVCRADSWSCSIHARRGSRHMSISFPLMWFLDTHTFPCPPSIVPSLPPLHPLHLAHEYRRTSRRYGRRQVFTQIGISHGAERDVCALFRSPGIEGRRNETREGGREGKGETATRLQIR